MDRDKSGIFFGNNFKSFLNKSVLEDRNLKILTKFFKDFQDNMDFAMKMVWYIQDVCKAIPDASYSLKYASDIIQKELGNFLIDIVDIKELIQKDVREPLQRFEEGFSATSGQFHKQGNGLMDELANIRKSVDRTKSAYFKSAKDLESAQGVLKSITDLDKESRKIRGKNITVLEKKSRMDEALEEYQKSLHNANKEIELKLSDCKNLADSIFQLDESRIEIIKYTLTKFINYTEQITRAFTKRSELMKASIKHINSNNDINKSLNKDSQSINPLFSYLEYEEYKYKNPLLKDKPLNDYTKIQIAFNKAMISITSKVQWTTEEKTTLIEYLHRSEGKEVLSKVLNNIREPFYIPFTTSFNDLGDLVVYLLNVMVMEQENESILNVILRASTRVHSLIDGKNKFLYTLLIGHDIFKDIGTWKLLIGIAIKEAIGKVKKQFVNNEYNTIISKPISEESKNKEMRKQISKDVFRILNEYASLLNSFKVNSKETKFLLRDYGRKYGLNIKSLYEIELNLIIQQPLYINGNHKINSSKRLTVIKLSISYIDNKQTLRKILLLNSGIYKSLRLDVYRQVLNSFNIPMQTRGEIWMRILQIEECKLDYRKVRNSLNSKTISIPEHIEGVIKADIQRSSFNSDIVNPTAVSNVLRVYAYCNNKVEYCQGMNFIVGFLFYFYPDEETTFKALAQLLKKLNMDSLLTQDILRYFFIMDRLLFLCFGELAEYLKNLGIKSCLYSSTWFLTFFTSILSYSKGEAPSTTLLTIWDEFLIQGWSVIFKAGLFILHQLHDKLLTLGFHEIMILLGKAAREIILQDSSALFKRFLEEVKVTDEMLEAINKEYDNAFEEIKKEEIQWIIPEEQ